MDHILCTHTPELLNPSSVTSDLMSLHHQPDYLNFEYKADKNYYRNLVKLVGNKPFKYTFFVQFSRTGKNQLVCLA